MAASGDITVNRLRRLVKAIRASAIERDTTDIESTSELVAALRSQVNGISKSLSALMTQVAETRRRSEELMALHDRNLDERVRIAGMPRAKLLSDALVLEGSPSERLRVRRVTAGESVERPFARWMGTTRCVSVAPDVRGLWERLLASEASCTDDMLRGAPSTILDIPDAIVSRANPRTLHVALQANARPAIVHDTQIAPDHALVAVPRFAYAFPPRKLRNFSHWLLDCLPQVVALSRVAPDAAFLLPHPLREFHRSSLSLVGLSARQMVSWLGAPTAGGRLLVLESDGRAGGGRPLSALVETRRLVAATSNDRRSRRIYVTRRDAKAKRRWVANEPDVETLFQSRGFEILCMTDRPLHELVTIFREAAVVAGINGAGLAHILFSSPGTHVIVLFSDSLIRWHADEGGSRSLWANGPTTSGGQLAALGDSPRFYAHLAAVFEQVCHSFVGPDDVPLDQLSAFLDDALRQADRT